MLAVRPMTRHVKRGNSVWPLTESAKQPHLALKNFSQHYLHSDLSATIGSIFVARRPEQQVRDVGARGEKHQPHDRQHGGDAQPRLLPVARSPLDGRRPRDRAQRGGLLAGVVGEESYLPNLILLCGERSRCWSPPPLLFAPMNREGQGSSKVTLNV